jgi:hypothetical protein
MPEKDSLEEFERHRQAGEEREAREEEARRERVEKESAKRVWIRDGGNARDFERSWPELRDEQRRRRTLDADERARASHRLQSHSKI